MGIHTLHVEHVVLLSIYTVLTLVNSWFYKETRGVHWFSLYSFLAFLGALAVALRGHIPDFLSIVVGNLLVVAGYVVLLRSLEELLGRRVPRRYLQAILFAAATATMLEYGWLQPNTRLRLIAYSVILGLQQIQIAVFILRRQRSALRNVGLPMAVILAALALTNLVRITELIAHGAPQDYLAAGPILSWIVVANTCLQCGAMVAYVWLTAALLRRELELQASTDPLTGLLNRRAMALASEQWIATCRRRGESVCAITIDLDQFKHINDTFGHSCGDTALTTVATCFQRNMRAQDALARLGGDEFGILLPRTSLPDALEVAERLRCLLASLDIACGDVHTRVTASFGVAQALIETSTWEHIARLCDRSLYTVKRSGGNLAISAEQHVC